MCFFFAVEENPSQTDKKVQKPKAKEAQKVQRVYLAFLPGYFLGGIIRVLAHLWWVYVVAPVWLLMRDNVFWDEHAWFIFLLSWDLHRKEKIKVSLVNGIDSLKKPCYWFKILCFLVVELWLLSMMQSLRIWSSQVKLLEREQGWRWMVQGSS